MLKKIIDFILRILLCASSFHSNGGIVQSHKEFHIYSCKRCGVLFSERKEKYKKIKK